MALETYNKKRRFDETPEPKGAIGHGKNGLLFVVQKHDASHLHYDFRLELDGVLKSWAVPKGPSLNPKDKRLAVEVEDHPFSYKDFEGTIPEGNYGAGEVIVWDNGTYVPADDSDNKKNLSKDDLEKKFLVQYKKGRMEFRLQGKKLKGLYSLFRTKNKMWLLVKKDDEEASETDITERNESVISERKLTGRNEKSISSVATKAASMSIPNKKPKAVKIKLGTDPMPHNISPMLATLTDKAFDDKDWIFEIKWDGYRAVAEIENSAVKLYSRNGLDFAQRYQPIAKGLLEIKHNAVLDGEIVALNEKGTSYFQSLQNYQKNPVNLTYQVFDILYLDGKDLTSLPLIERKEILKSIIPKSKKNDIIKYSDHIEAKGISFFKEASKIGLEGIMAKRKDSKYSFRRTEDWLKIKTELRQEVIITGFTEPRGSRSLFGSLVLGIYKEGKLTYVGHSGSGFDQTSLKYVHDKLKKIVRKTSPFEKAPKTNMPVTWVEPKILCEVKFAEWTNDGQMRQPIFMGLREDKKAKDVVREDPKEKSADQLKSVEFTHTDKIYFPKPGYTKGDLIEYYDKISETILPYLKDRPESLNRHPNGVTKPGFYQKNITNETPSFVETISLFSESTQQDVNYLLCQNKETLLYMANLGCIEINPWSSRLKTLDRPDYLVIDLDPGENTIKELVQVAQEVHKVLEMSCQKSYVKTSGKTGIHIFVPLGGKFDFEEVRTFAKFIATLVHDKLPDITSIERSPSKRTKKIYLDYLQNSEGQTLAAPYSVRPTEGATVSTPLMWKEVNPKLDPKKFTIKTIFARLKKHGDLWEPMHTEAIDLKESIKCLEKALKK